MGGMGISDMDQAEEANNQIQGEGNLFIIGGGSTSSIMRMIPEEIVKVIVTINHFKLLLSITNY